MKTKLSIIVSLLVLISFTACKRTPEPPAPTDTPTSGEISLVADENYQPLVEEIIKVFHADYPRAKVNITYKNEKEAFDYFIKDSAQGLFSSRLFNQNEKNLFQKDYKYQPKYALIGHDGLAILIHPSRKDSVFSIKELSYIVSGKVTEWSQIQKSSKGKITLVFDEEKSSTVRYMKDSICKCSEFSKNAFAAKSHLEVIDYVAKNPNSIGVIGINWISNGDDPGVVGFKKSIRVASISKLDDKLDFYQPYPAYIAQKKYPLPRRLYFLNRQPRVGLANGIATFSASNKGQLIVYRSGLVPATMPVRLIKVTKDL
jgi:phosphate transport system substrate-binding protein